MMIPKQLRQSDFRFVLLGKWDDVIKKEGGKDLFKGKAPFEIKWQTENNYRFDSKKLLNHKNNFGIIGGYGKLRILDIDDKKLGEEFEKKLKTFTVKTGGGGKHFYFISDYETNHVLINELGELRANNYQVVSAPCKHPSGNYYEVVKDIPIQTISYEELFKIIKPYLREENPPIKKVSRSDTTRSALEYRKIISLLRQGKQRKEIYEIMDAYSKWATGHEKYKSLTFEKAENFVLEEREKIGDKISNESIEEDVLTLLLLKKRDEATECIVKFIEDNNFIYTTKDDIKSEMWIYKEGVYLPQGRSEVKEKIRKILGKTYTSQIYNRIIEKIEADTFIEHDKFFQTNYLDEVPVENGILNIFTRELKPFDPKKIFFNKLPIKYNLKDSCPNILKFLSDVLKHQEDIPVMLEIIGFSLLKEYRFEKAFMFVGSGRNGKSKTLELIKRMIGIQNCCSVPLSMITADSTSVIEMFGKMVNLAGDLSNDSLKKTGMFKQTVGRDVIAAKRKYLRDLIFVNYAKHIFATNELPKVYDLSDGFWTKWLLLEFPYKFIPQKEYDSLSEEDKIGKKILDPNIIEKITSPKEMAGLLNIALDSLKILLEKEDFSYSKGTAEIKELWVRQSDSFTAFCMDKIVEDYNDKITKKEIRKEFYKYCKSNKLKGAGDKAIKATLQDRYGATENQTFGEGDRYWEGIRFK